MKKITFKVSTKKEGSVVSLIKEVNKISCRIQIDFENGFVTVENVEDNMIDSSIELIDQYYTISSVNIDNISDESTLVETSQSDIVTNEPEAEVEKTTKLENKPTVVGPQSEDELIIQKVEFENEYIENLINKLMRTVYWAMYRMNVPEKEIGDFIWTSINEISMRYNKKGCIEYSVEDINGVDNSKVTMSEPKPKKDIKKVGSQESALLNIIGDSLEKLNRTKTVEEQVETFLIDIGMATTEKMVTQSFVIACNIKKINYENVIIELHNMFPKVKENIIKLILKENFKKWLDVHPELVESCPKISLISVLKVFAKRFA